MLIYLSRLCCCIYFICDFVIVGTACIDLAILVSSPFQTTTLFLSNFHDPSRPPQSLNLEPIKSSRRWPLEWYDMNKIMQVRGHCPPKAMGESGCFNSTFVFQLDPQSPGQNHCQ